MAWSENSVLLFIVLDHAGTIFVLKSERFSEIFDLRRGGPRWNQIESFQEQRRKLLSIETSGLVGVTNHAQVKKERLLEARRRFIA